TRMPRDVCGTTTPSVQHRGNMPGCARQNTGLDTRLSWLGLGVTTVCSCAALYEIVGILIERAHAGAIGPIVQLLGLLAFVAVFPYGGYVYQLTRLACLRRSRAHVNEPLEALEAQYGSEAPRVTVLVPSYKEDVHVVRKTLISAALQEYPGL